MGILGYSLAFSVYSLGRYYSFRTLYFDLGIFSSSMSHVLRGTEGLQTLILPSTPGHVGHFSPILVVPLALYAVLPSPATLLVFQSLLLALAALPLFELAFEVLHRTDLSVGIALLYLLCPALQGVNRYDFHVEAFVPLFAFYALLAVVRKHYPGFLVASLLLLVTHEYLSIVFLWTGSVLVAFQLLAKRDLLLGLVSRRWSVTALLLGGGFLALEEALNVLLTPSHASVFGWLGATTPGFSGGATQVVGGLTVDMGFKVLYWAILLAPLLFVPLRESRLMLPAVPWLGLTLIASNPAIYSIYTQYPAFVLPFLVFAAIWALRRPQPIPRLTLSGRRLAVAFVAAGLIASATIGPLSPLNAYDGALSNHEVPPWPPLVTAHDQATARLLGLVPADARILGQNELFPQVSSRAEVAPYWNVSASGPPDFIAADAGRVWFGDALPPYPSSLELLATSIMQNGTYGVAGFSGTAFLYERARSGPPSLSIPAATQPSPAEFAASWTVSGAAVAVGAGALQLRPGNSSLGLAWMPVSSPGDLLAAAELAWTNRTGAGARSGLVLGEPNTLTFQVVFVDPGTSLLGYERFVQGALQYASLATVPLRGNSVYLQVLASGGELQVWTDGRFAGFFHGEPSADTTALGFASSGQDLTATSLSAYRSIADQAPEGGEIPWDGIAATLGIVIPVLALLWVVPQPDLLAARFVRRLRGR